MPVITIQFNSTWATVGFDSVCLVKTHGLPLSYFLLASSVCLRVNGAKEYRVHIVFDGATKAVLSTAFAYHECFFIFSHHYPVLFCPLFFSLLEFLSFLLKRFDIYFFNLCILFYCHFLLLISDEKHFVSTKSQMCYINKYDITGRCKTSMRTYVGMCIEGPAEVGHETMARGLCLQHVHPP